MPVTLTVCITCKFATDRAVGEDGRTGGAMLADMIGAELRNRDSHIGLVPHECLWSCREHCCVLIEADGTTGYLAGRFAPEPAAAAAVVDWTERYASSDTGVVRYRDWPDGMKGHFIARIPFRAAVEED